MPRRSTSKKRGRRPAGRPHASGKTVGADTLVAVTRELLQTRSPQMVTRQEIARAAKVDPALIRYYFGNRDNLLLAATMQIEREHRAREAEAINAATSATDKLKAKIKILFEILVENIQYNQLIFDKIHSGKGADAQAARHEMVQNSFGQLKAIIEAGVKAGELRSVDPRFLHMAMVGLCQFFFSRRPLLEELMGRSVSPLSLSNEYMDFVMDLVINGISAQTVQGAAVASRQTDKKSSRI